jgi:hypothetical protein
METFPQVDPPPVSAVAKDYRDGQGKELKDAFGGKNWWDIRPPTVRAHSDQLSIFSPVAYHYYFPVYLLTALNDFSPDNEVVELCVYNLTGIVNNPDHDYSHSRRKLFTLAEKQVIGEYLGLVLIEKTMEHFHEDALIALEFVEPK